MNDDEYKHSIKRLKQWALSFLIILISLSINQVLGLIVMLIFIVIYGVVMFRDDIKYPDNDGWRPME